MDEAIRQQAFFSVVINDQKAVSPEIKENHIASRQRRIGAYTYAYMARIVDVVESDFPMLKKYLNEDLASLIQEAIKLYPSTSIDIAELSKNFLHFLDSEGRQKELELAKFEFLYALAFDYKQIKSDLIKKISATAEEILPDKICILNPSIHLYTTAFKGLDIKKPEYIDKMQYHYFIYSYDYARQIKLLDAKDIELYKALKNNVSIASLAEQFDETILSSLFTWAQAGILIDIN